MTHQYSIDQAQTHLEQILNEVEQGSSVELTRSGKRIAVLISTEEYDQLRSNKTGFWEALQEFRQQLELEAIDIEPEIFEGIRDKSPGREVIL
jgi:cellobiose PTS system EIIB component